MNNKTLVVVLGMHRSGTSAITRGLQVLGIGLGNHLMEPLPEINEKGFFEDLDINAINIELLESLQHNWHSLSPISYSVFNLENNQSLRDRAITLLKSRLQDNERFAFKDPRTCLLLPFWQPIFAELECKVFYLIVVRNPLSVIESLYNTYGLAIQKGHYLWFKHIFDSVVHTRGESRLVVDYDSLLENPEKQLMRVAHTLKFDNKIDADLLNEYKTNFLDKKLRHRAYKDYELENNPDIPKAVKSVFNLLSDAAAEKLCLDSVKFDTEIKFASEMMESAIKALIYIDQLDNLIIDHDQRIHTLKETLETRSSELSETKDNLSEQKQKIDYLKNDLAVKDDRICDLENTVNEKSDEIRMLNDFNYSNKSLMEQSRLKAIQLHYRINKIYDSSGWRLLAPIRAIIKLIKHITSTVKIEMIPVNHLQKEKDSWKAKASAPRFLLVADKDWSTLSGWHWLSMSSASDDIINAQILFDLGDGIDPESVVNINITGNGPQNIPLYIPPACKAVCLDLCVQDKTFKLKTNVIKKIKNKKLPSFNILNQSAMYGVLGDNIDYSKFLKPLEGIIPLINDKYSWESVTNDPQFLLDKLYKDMPAGWYSIQLLISSGIDSDNGKLYFDYGKGFNEIDTTLLPYINDVAVSRLCYIKGKLKKIRFDPLESKSMFSIKTLTFSSLDNAEAKKIMLQQLLKYSDNNDQSELDIWDEIVQQASKVQKQAIEFLKHRYDQYFYDYQDANLYQKWMKKYEVPIFIDMATINKTQESFLLKPLISVIMPVYNPDEEFLRLAIKSILNQSYSNLELCIADDASTRNHVKNILNEFVKQDSRVKVNYRTKNGHISAASNTALSLATGEYIALVDHDDELSRHALHFIVESINENPNAKIFYTDEDKVNNNGMRSQPHFKSDWNPDLLLSQNYISHLGVYHKKLLDDIGGFREGYEGSQDYDLLLRCLKFVDHSEIIHISKILYHWRQTIGSTALRPEEKGYTTKVGIRALQDFFKEKNKSVSIEAGAETNTYRVRYQLSQPQKLVSLLIPTRDKLELIKSCVDSILEKTTYLNYEIFILDNDSVETKTLDYFDQIQCDDNRVKVISYKKPFNFSAINNFGVKQANGSIIGLINNDIQIISPDWLSEMVSHAERPEIGCVGAKLYYDDKSIQHAGVILGLGGVAGHSHKYYSHKDPGYFCRLKLTQNVMAVTAACLVVRKNIFNQVGGFDEKNLKIAFNDVDFCLKVHEAGYLNLWTPFAELYHYESKSRGLEDNAEKISRFNSEVDYMKTKWGNLLENDPYYNVNLTLDKEDFSYKL